MRTPSAVDGELQPKQKALLHRRDAEFTEIGVCLDQELFTLRRVREKNEKDFLVQRVSSIFWIDAIKIATRICARCKILN